MYDAKFTVARRVKGHSNSACSACVNLCLVRMCSYWIFFIPSTVFFLVCRFGMRLVPELNKVNRNRCRAKRNVLSCRMLTPSTECHRKSFLWLKPTNIGCHGNIPRGIKTNFKLIIYNHSSTKPTNFVENRSGRC